MPLIFGANSVSGYTVKNSLRFNSGSSDYLNRTPASAGNRKTWTYSAWIKRVNLATADVFLSVGVDSSNYFNIYFQDDSTQSYLILYQITSAATDLRLVSSAMYRDVSAWYHLVVSCDTTQATASNRLKAYINGTEVTSFSTATYPTQNLDTRMNSTQSHNIGKFQFASSYSNQYLSEVYLIDGQALTPSSFGETDTDTGIWIPKAYTGTYGTNGFFLKFLNSASLGTDSSGNGNNFTVNNLTSVDQSTDTPTNNFCTLNPLVQAGSITSGATHTFSNGNLTLTGGTSKWIADYGSFAVKQGKWYYEMKLTTFADAVGSPIRIGWGAINDVVKDDNIYFRGLTYDLQGIVRYGSGGVDGGTTTGQTSFSQSDIVGIAIDVDNDRITFYKNGTVTSVSNFDYSSLTTNIKKSLGFDIAPHIVMYANNSNLVDFNFGNPQYTANGYTDGAGYGNFSYAVPSGYYALCTKNLANYG